MRSNTILALAASLSTGSAYYTGFNYGATFSDGYTVKVKANYTDEFTTAKNLVGTNGEFTAARLYTTIQGGSTSDPNEAIEAAIDTSTLLLLGLWASAGSTDFANELSALSNAIDNYGDDFTSLVIGISVGSEDLYRSSEMGVEADAGVGVGPDVIVDYISQLRSLIKGTALADTPVGHVDTWTAWVNGSNSAVIDAVDFLGFDGYPYFQNTMSNPISAGKTLFYEAVDETVAVANGKDVWITETGWPVSGDDENEAVASVANAKTYWDDVACSSIGNMNVFWYTLQDSAPTTPSPSFGLVGSSLTTTPLYNLTCPAGSNTTSTASGSTASSTGSVSASVITTATATITGTISGSLYTSTLVATSTVAASNSTATGSSSSGSSTKSSSSSSATVTSSSSGATSLSASFLGGVLALIGAVALL